MKTVAPWILIVPAHPAKAFHPGKPGKSPFRKSPFREAKDDDDDDEDEAEEVGEVDHFNDGFYSHLS